jgi:cytochrome bd-type quinol oxidase subunit 2
MLMKAGEITRTVVFVVIGTFLMFVLQPLLYARQIIYISDVEDVENWLNDFYMKKTLIVFFASVLASIIWLAFAATTKDHRVTEVSKSQTWWWIIGLIPIVAIGFAINLDNSVSENSKDALLSLTFFYVFDFLLLYWITTATSTPGILMFIPPFSNVLRDLIGAR